MAWHFFKKLLPNHTEIKNHPRLQWLGARLHDPNLWHWRKTGVARGVAVGLFVVFLPLPLQMVLAAILAYWFRANLPIAVALSWLNNPFTFIPINYMVYKVGAFITGEKIDGIKITEFKWHLSNIGSIWNELFAWFGSLGKTYFIGLPIVCFGAAILGYLLVEIIWRTVLYFKHK